MSYENKQKTGKVMQFCYDSITEGHKLFYCKRSG